MIRSIGVWIGAVTILTAQQPAISNAKLQNASAAGGLDAAIQAAIGSITGPFWIGYAVPIVSGERQSCCWSNDSRGCGLEGQRGVVSGTPSGPVQLEGPTHAAILLRVDNREVRKIRAFSLDCPLDAGGLTVQWLSDVRPAQSIAMLERLAGAQTAGKAGESAIHAIAMHAGPESDKSLERFASSGSAEAQRKSAIFWLANSRGRQGFEVVSRIARQDASEKVREHAIFALTLSKEAEAIPTIIGMAKEDSSARVRGQALFWLAQKASRDSSRTITEAINNDPDTEVKKKAVFALSQLPKEQGVPLLIQVARTHQNAAVRKQAMFWLGQSRDPRALGFFEEVLKK